jgi:hypothetical protein
MAYIITLHFLGEFSLIPPKALPLTTLHKTHNIDKTTARVVKIGVMS